MGGRMPCSLNIGDRCRAGLKPARREQDYLTKMINNVKIAKDSMNANPSTNSV